MSATPTDPEELTATTAPADSVIPAGTTMGAVHLTVADLARSRDYYRQVIGLEELEQGGGRASLGAGGVELLVLTEEPGAKPADGYTGLYHFALLLPGRSDLARWLAHAVRERVPLTGASDHFVSEALYLSDPDRHGIEIYWDRPRALWEGQVGRRLGSWPLDVDDLLGALEDRNGATFDGLPAGTSMGHVHLRVAGVPETIAFYRDVLGFGLMAQLGDQAAFLAAGGYHHHLGANTWESRGAAAAPAGTTRLLHATIVLPDADARAVLGAALAESGLDVDGDAEDPVVRDPSGIALLLAAARNDRNRDLVERR